MNFFRDLYHAERDMNEEYYLKNKNIFALAEKDNVKRIYKRIVSPITFGVIQGTLMCHFLMFGKNCKNKLGLAAKLFGVTVLNAQLFLYGYEHYQQPTKMYRFGNSLISPMFTLQKDRIIISTISSFITWKSRNNNKTISNSTYEGNNDNNQSSIKKPKQINEGFL